MNFLKSILLIACVALIINSCKKDKPEDTPVYPSYSALKAGNYWVYERFTIDTLGNATTQNIFDSTYVEKDTVINNQTYFKLFKAGGAGHPSHFVFLRDSLHYIINATGGVIFSSQDFSTIFKLSYYTFGANNEDTISKMICKMEDKDATVSTPAGNFATSDYQEINYMYPGFDHADNPRRMHSRYAENVGLVKETLHFYVLSTTYTERRLVRYKVE